MSCSTNKSTTNVLATEAFLAHTGTIQIRLLLLLLRYETTLTGQMSVIDTMIVVPTPSTAHLSEMLLFQTPFSVPYTDEILHL